MSPLRPQLLRSTAATITVVAGLVLLIDLPGPVRIAAVLIYFLVAPGLAALPALSLETAIGQAAAAVGLSLAALVLVSEVLLYLGVSGAGWAFAFLAGLTLLACGLPSTLARRGVEP